MKEIYDDLSAFKIRPILYNLFTSSLRIPTYVGKKYLPSNGLQNLQLPIKQQKFHNLYPNDDVLVASTIVAILQMLTFVPLIVVTAVWAHWFMPELSLVFR